MTGKELVRLDKPNSSVAKYKFELVKDKAKYHSKKTHIYSWRVVKYSAKGSVPVAKEIYRKLCPPEATIEYHNALKKNNEKATERARSARFRGRLYRITPAALGTYTLVSWVNQSMGWWGIGAMGLAAITGLAVVGSRLDGEQITDVAPVRRRELSQERLDHALRAIGLLNKPKEGQEIDGTSISVIGMGAARVQIEGSGVTGTEIEFDFPVGAKGTYSALLKQRDAFAGQLGVREMQLDLKRADLGGEQSISMLVFDSDPLDSEPIRSPLLFGSGEIEKRTNIWEGSRLGTDARGFEVLAQLIWESIYISGTPRKGKSNILRVIASFAALDPYLDFMCINFKGSKDLKPLQSLALRYVSGKSEADAKRALDILREVNRISDERQKLMEGLDDDINPDSKLTPEIVDRYNMRPVLVMIDELELGVNAFKVKEERDEFLELLSDIARGGPSAGIIFVVASQRPDSKSIPTKFRDVVNTKISVQTANRQSSDLVLGEGAAASGFDASKLPFVEGRAARCIIMQGSEGRVVKTDFINMPDFQRICQKGMQLRSAAGTLRPEGEETKVDTIIDRVIAELEKEDFLEPAELALRLGFTRKDAEGKTVGSGEKLANALKHTTLKAKHDGTKRSYSLEDASSTAG